MFSMLLPFEGVAGMTNGNARATSYLERATRARVNAEEALDDESKAMWLRVAAQWDLMAAESTEAP